MMLMITNTAILIWEIGWLGVILPVSCILVCLAQALLNSSLMKWKNTNMKIADARGKKITEMIQGIKMIKFNAWENILMDQTKSMREKERTLMSAVYRT
jgi:ABC-type bacteriocin/lantibiotic exporter with double-glycine peptidase domain